MAWLKTVLLISCTVFNIFLIFKIFNRIWILVFNNYIRNQKIINIWRFFLGGQLGFSNNKYIFLKLLSFLKIISHLFLNLTSFQFSSGMNLFFHLFRSFIPYNVSDVNPVYSSTQFFHDFLNTHIFIIIILLILYFLLNGLFEENLHYIIVLLPFIIIAEPIIASPFG